MHRTTARNRAKYQFDEEYAAQVRERVAEHQSKPEVRERRKAYMREYSAARKQNPTLAELDRARGREKQRRLRADPATREARLAARRDKRAGAMLERVVEQYLIEQVEMLGGFCPKFNDPGHRGAPDRLVMLPGFPTIYAELKRPVGGWLEPHQKRYHDRIRKAGQTVIVINTKAKVDSFLADKAAAGLV